ncbi:uncharacterized protein OCT59_020592 [Rhizophagus irregularis]|uniref:uncharacterized protein n=1 Tax=Rhizophagus irregularis TaxID=588596 RepID=UPI000CB15C1E|nr:hypothetical protein OCT59_020592 [Rhizophagus irregularis]CAB5136669.1 unnamed protein product [Rhizophagus irregularis]
MVQPILIEPPEISGHFLLSIQNLVCIVNPTFVLFFVFLLSLFSTAYHIPSCEIKKKIDIKFDNINYTITPYTITYTVYI